MPRISPELLLSRTDPETPPLLRMPTVMRMTGLARSTIYQMIADQRFPTPVRLGPRAVAWRRSDLDRWSEARPAVSSLITHQTREPRTQVGLAKHPLTVA
jgi:prophage regulatory protein